MFGNQYRLQYQQKDCVRSDKKGWGCFSFCTIGPTVCPSTGRLDLPGARWLADGLQWRAREGPMRWLARLDGCRKASAALAVLSPGWV